MLGFAAVVLAILCVGFAVLELLRKRFAAAFDDTEPLELFTAAALVGGSLWIAANWILALTGLFTRPALLGVTALFGAVALVMLFRLWPRLRSYEIATPAAVQLALIAPLFVWIVFILWRGSVLPPLTHDVLGYHLPKAVMILRAHGFDYFVAPDTRISHLPANYELLLADVLALSGTDRLTEWIGTTTFILFLLATGAVAQRWWRRGLHVIPAIAAVATAPVLILHSGADKNDLLSGLLAVCALLWGARWAAKGGTLPMMLLVTALTTGAGTKPQQAAILVGLAPFLLRRVWREVRESRRALLRLGAIAIAAVLWFGVTGGAAYVYNAVHESSPLEVQIGGGDSGNAPKGVFQWGDWSNLWQFPYLLLTVPFSGVPSAVWVPWKREFWFWPHYEIYFSHFGMLTSLLMVALPYCVYRFGRRGTGADDRGGERLVYSVAALLAFLLTLPVQFRPFGYFGSFPRYLLYVLPAIACWTVAPLFRFTLEGSAARRNAGSAILGGISAFLAFTACRMGQRDQFAPWQFVRWAAANPGTRVVYFSPNRASEIVDRLAGPHDRIAVDGSFDTWTYPAYGAGLTRDLVYLPPSTPGQPVLIPDDARWVIVDRSWSSFWGHPLFTDMGKFWEYRSKGKPTAADLAIYHQLLTDPRFALVYRDDGINQAVFWRRVPGQPAPKPRLMRFHHEPKPRH